MAQMHLGTKTIQMADETAAEFQEVIRQLLERGVSFQYVQEGSDRMDTTAISIWVHPAINFSVTFDHVTVPPVDAQELANMARYIQKTGKFFVQKND